MRIENISQLNSSSTIYPTQVKPRPESQIPSQATADGVELSAQVRQLVNQDKSPTQRELPLPPPLQQIDHDLPPGPPGGGDGDGDGGNNRIAAVPGVALRSFLANQSLNLNTNTTTSFNSDGDSLALSPALSR